jgi:hypothetical protein
LVKLARGLSRRACGAANTRFNSKCSSFIGSFEFDAPPGPTPTPPVKQALGQGPFLSREEAFAAAQKGPGDGSELKLLDARLVSEAELRKLGSTCATFPGHPDGVWLLRVEGIFYEKQRIVFLGLDATTGKRLCGEEVTSDTAASTMPPGTTQVSTVPAGTIQPTITAAPTVPSDTPVVSTPPPTVVFSPPYPVPSSQPYPGPTSATP